MRIAILGGPGSGKEIQARRLAERFRVPCISAADLLRQAADESAPGTKTASRSRSRSKAAPAPKPATTAAPADATERVVRLLEERLRARDAKRGFVIDGFPRSIPEAQELDTLLEMFGRALQIAVCLQVDDRALIKRVTEQLECASCGALYDRRRRRRLPADARAQCDTCGGPLTATSAKTAAAQIAAYRFDADPLANYYKAQHKLRTLSGGQSESAGANEDAADEVQQKIVDLVNLEINPLDVKNLEPAAVEPDEHEGIIIAGGQINRIDPTEDILAARRPGQENAGAAATATATAATKKNVEKKPAAAAKATENKVAKKPPAKRTVQTVKKPAPAKKTAAKKVAAKPATKPPAGKAAKKTAAKKSTQRPAKKPVAKKPVAKKSAAKPAAKPAAKKVAKKTAKKPQKTSGHG